MQFLLQIATSLSKWTTYLPISKSTLMSILVFHFLQIILWPFPPLWLNNLLFYRPISVCYLVLFYKLDFLHLSLTLRHVKLGNFKGRFSLSFIYYICLKECKLCLCNWKLHSFSISFYEWNGVNKSNDTKSKPAPGDAIPSLKCRCWSSLRSGYNRQCTKRWPHSNLQIKL